MSDRPQTPDDVKAIVAERDIRFIRLWFTDILGQLKSFSINAEELDDAFEGGMGFDGSSITGFNAIEESDMIAMPDPSTFQIIPWSPQDTPTARMICDVRTPEGDPYVGDPRHVLRRALERADVALLDRMHAALRGAIAALPDRQLHATPRGRKSSHFAIIAAVAAHDLYHAGQIQLLKRLGRG